MVSEGGELSGSISGEEIAKEKIRDILAGDLFVHFTHLNSVPYILRDGILSKSYAASLGIKEVVAEWPIQSSPNHVYYYRESKSEEENRKFFQFMFSPQIQTSQNIVVLLDKSQIIDEEAKPQMPLSILLPGWGQGMAWQRIPQEAIVGITVLSGALGNYLTPERQKDIESTIGYIKDASSSNPYLAVPVYDQNGNVLWPVVSDRGVILKPKK